MQLRHIFEIHAVYARERRRDREDRRPGGELPGDPAGPLLLQKGAEFEYRRQRFAKGVDAGLYAANMVLVVSAA